MNIEALSRRWDIVVVGAGVAGAVAAYRLARRGLKVLLVEKASWPRDKVCGGCLNAAALRALADAGLSDVMRAGQAYSSMRLASEQRQAVLGLPTGRAISRRYLDALLVEQAVAVGVRFLSATQALLGGVGRDQRSVTLRHADQRVTVSARLVIGSDGLGSRLLREAMPEALDVKRGSRIGVGTTVDGAPGFYQAGMIHMACGTHGYVGLVRVENDRLTIGAALDPAWVKHRGGPLLAVTDLLNDANFPLFDGLLEASWQGTPRLTRQRTPLGAERVLILGDAAGYVEPFTGEGMGWALASAAAIEPLALDAVGGWRNELVGDWTARHAEVVGARQRDCQTIAAILRHPHLIAALLPMINAAPATVAPLTAWLNRSYALEPMENE